MRTLGIYGRGIDHCHEHLVTDMSKTLAITSTIIIIACTAVGIFFITQIFRHFDDVSTGLIGLLADAMKTIVVLASICFGVAGFFAFVLGFALARMKAAST